MAKKCCWFASLPGAGECDGKLRKCHLIRRQVIRREAGPMFEWDPRVWVWGCGGITGIGGHHGMLDYSRRLRVPRDRLPATVEEFAVEVGLEWWLEREYGLRPETV
jgi:hypothetical protein